MKFRILKNEDHYVIQKKVFFFWVYLKYVCWEKIPQFCFLSKNIQRGCQFSSLLVAEQKLLECRQYYRELQKKNSKYVQVNSKVCSELYNKLNSEE